MNNEEKETMRGQIYSEVVSFFENHVTAKIKRKSKRVVISYTTEDLSNCVDHLMGIFKEHK